MSMRVGTAPITWGVCEIPGWGDELPPQRVLAEMAALGFAGTELGPWGYLPSPAERLRTELKRYGLSLIGGFCPVTLHRSDTFDEQLTFGIGVASRLHDLGATVFVLADAGDEARRAAAGHPDRGAAPEFTGGEWERFTEGISELARRAADMGLITAFHPHAGTYVETEPEIEELLRRTPSGLVGLCIDTGHLLFGGADPIPLTLRHAARVRHVHVKDVSSQVLKAVRSDHLPYLEAVDRGIFVPLGDGMVDIPSFLRALQAVNYDGWVVLEQDVRLRLPEGSDIPRLNAKRSRQTLLSFGL
ncbi:MAG: TIM barrel protein [Chloroflexi bacterium]|nr:TIM barrel protein [Chloroflexota bacterium]